MERKGRHNVERRVAVGAAAGAICAAGLLLLGFRHAHPPRPAAVPAAHQAAFAGFVTPPGSLQGVVVVLDPGHGGMDPGAVCGPVSEAALTYRTADEVAAGLRAQGAEVVYTVQSRMLDPRLAAIEPPLARPADAVMAATGNPLRLRHSPKPLWQRAARARQVWMQRVRQDPDARRDVFFLSLHYDEYRSEGVSGSVVCVDRRVHRVPAFAGVLAREMAQGHFGRRCEFQGLAGVSGHELGVLDPAYNPIPEKVLLEVTTLSNAEDALQADDPLWRGEMARLIVDAVTRVHRQTVSGPLNPDPP